MHPSPRADPETIEPSPLDADALRRWPMPNLAAADKYSRGTVLVIGGSPSTPGAVVLAGVAALRMGAGRLQIATAEAVAAQVGVAVPEAMVVGLCASASGLEMSDQLARSLGTVDALLIGPGMVGETPPTELLTHVVETLGDEAMVVVDALALPAFGALDDERRLDVQKNPHESPEGREIRCAVRHLVGISPRPVDRVPRRGRFFGLGRIGGRTRRAP